MVVVGLLTINDGATASGKGLKFYSMNIQTLKWLMVFLTHKE